MAAEDVTAAQLITLNARTGSTIDAQAVTGITSGTAAQFEQIMDNEGTNGDKINLDGDFTVTVSNGTTTAAQRRKLMPKHPRMLMHLQ